MHHTNVIARTSFYSQTRELLTMENAQWPYQPLTAGTNCCWVKFRFHFQDMFASDRWCFIRLYYTHRQAKKDMKRPTEQGPLFIEHCLLLGGWDHSPTLMGIGGVCLRTALSYINPRWVHQISRENGLQYGKVVVTEIRASLSCQDMGSVSCGANSLLWIFDSFLCFYWRSSKKIDHVRIVGRSLDPYLL